MTQDNTLIVTLQQAFCECIGSAPNLLYNNISDTIKNIEFNTSPYDACVFNERKDVAQCSIGVLLMI